jgi:hypothetical protein
MLMQAQWNLESAMDLIRSAIQGDSGDDLCNEISGLITELNVDILELSGRVIADLKGRSVG